MFKKYRKKQYIDKKPYLKEMAIYFAMQEWPHNQTITKVDVYKTSKETVIEIESYRPGLLIGKEGKFIDNLTKMLELNFNEKIKINLTNCSLWDGCNVYYGLDENYLM